MPDNNEKTANTISIVAEATQGDPDQIEMMSDVLDSALGLAANNIAEFVQGIFDEEISPEFPNDLKRIRKAMYEILMEDIYVPLMIRNK